MTFKAFAKNYAGRDFVVGDIHGCFSLLEEELKELDFKESVDRLFSVGDLVDRGSESYRCLEFLEKPWFHAVMGNHEEMAIKFVTGHWPIKNYLLNGGQWLVNLSSEEQKVFIYEFMKLPYAIEIADTWSSGKVGLVHAECVYDDWEDFKIAISDNFDLEETIWGRTRITSSNQSIVKNINHIFVGHTPVKSPSRLGNHVYIDTGAVFGNQLTIIQL